MSLRITSTALNAGTLAYECVRSVLVQTHQDWTHYYFDAKSDDATQKLALDAAHLSGKQDARVEVLSESVRTGVFDKLLPLWRSFHDDDVIVWLDGDDALATPRALETVALAHAAGAMVTYGQFIWGDGTIGFAAPVGPHPRSEPWRATHLKTFRAGLAKRIKDEDLRSADGSYSRFATDQCVMLPLLEMAPGRSTFIPKVLHLYNDAHSNEKNRNPGDAERERADVALVRSRSRYDRVAL